MTHSAAYKTTYIARLQDLLDGWDSKIEKIKAGASNTDGSSRSMKELEMLEKQQDETQVLLDKLRVETTEEGWSDLAPAVESALANLDQAVKSMASGAR